MREKAMRWRHPKTVSLQVMAEGFARAGVPVFAADIKGDLSGISEVGESRDFIVKRASDMGLSFHPDQFSTVFWDVFGEQGHPVTRSVTNKVVGGVAADLGKSVGGSIGGSVGRAIVRGALGGLLRR